MLVNDILDQARAETHTTATQYPNTTLIGWLNDSVYKPLVKRVMTEVKEKYFNTTKYLDAVANQDSYALQSNFGKLSLLKVKPTTSSDWAVSREIDFAAQDYDYEYFANNQPMDQPVHQITGTNMFMLAPRFTSETAGTAGNNQIYYEYDATQSSLSVGGAEATIVLPVEHHHVLVKGLKPIIYSALGKTNEKNDARSEYVYEVGDMLYEMRGRDETENTLSTPNDILLQ